MKNLFITGTGVALLIALAACTGATQEAADISPPPARAGVSTSTEVVRTHLFKSAYLADAEITTAAGLIAVIAKVQGQLDVAPPSLGTAVRAGETLARLETRDLDDRLEQARLDLERVAAQLRVARDTFQEHKTLAEKDFISQNTVRASQLNADSLEIQYRSAKIAHEAALRNAKYAVIVSPADGVVASRPVTQGMHVAAGAVVAELLPQGLNNTMELALILPERMHPEIGPETRVTLEGHPSVAVVRKEPTVNSARSFKAFAPLPPGLEPLVGRTFRVSVEGPARPAVAVPESALVMKGSDAFVFIVEGDKAKQVKVSPGLRQDGRVAVEGLPENSEIAVTGAAFLREGSPIIRVEGQ